MALIDYGVIAFKNNKLISTKTFPPMIETTGLSVEPFDSDYFITLGNSNLLLGFYKDSMYYRASYECFQDKHTESGYINFRLSPYEGWKSWNRYLGTTNVVVKPRHGYFVCTFTITEGDNQGSYKVFFGHGVDLNWYLKTHFVNYFRTNPKYLFHKLFHR